MWAICKKELLQFFSGLTGYIAIIVFLLVNGLVLFVFGDNLLEAGYATLDPFFALAPWVLLFLIPAITMRSFAEEFRSGTFELLRTRPLSRWALTGGKFLGAFTVAAIALLPTLTYYFTVNALAATSGIDSGAAAGSYLGLLLLAALFTAIGLCVSSFTHNAVVAFILTVVACVLFYFGFRAVSTLLGGGADYYVQLLGIDAHYDSLARGVIDTRDLVYFLSLAFFFLFITRQNLERR